MHLPSLFIVHGVVFSSWLVVLVSQAFLVSAGKIQIHKKLGYTGIAIVVAMLVLGWIMSVQAAQRGFTPPGGPPPLSFLAFQIIGSFCVAGNRRISAAQSPGSAQAADDCGHGQHTYSRFGAAVFALQHQHGHLQGTRSAAGNSAD